MSTVVSEICERLRGMFEDGSVDIVSLATAIDLYAGQLNENYAIEGVVEFLECLEGLLKKDHEIVRELGWDLPKVLIGFINQKNLNWSEGLANDRVWHSVQGCFTEVSTYGNPKECFLTVCDLLSQLNIIGDDAVDEDDIGSTDISKETETLDTYEEMKRSSDDERQLSKGHQRLEDGESSISLDHLVDEERREAVFALRFHILLEFMTATLRRIPTLYPSRFLGEAIGVIFKLVKSHSDSINNVQVVLRRLYVFYKDYTDMVIRKVPSNKVSSNEDLKITIQEEQLQRELICSALTYSVAQLMKNSNPKWSVEYFSLKNYIPFESSDVEKELRLILEDFANLAESLNIDFMNEFIQSCIEESKYVYTRTTQNDSKSNERVTVTTSDSSEVIYQLAYTYELKKLADIKRLILDSRGVLLMFLVKDLKPGKMWCSNYTINDAIYMYLRFNTPSMYSKSFTNKSVTDCTLYLLIKVLSEKSYKENYETIQELPKNVNMVFIQISLINACTQRDSQLRMMQLNILAKILSLVPESIAFDFIVNTMLQCPYESAKSIVLDIAKELMLKDRYEIGSISYSSDQSKNDEAATQVSNGEFNNVAPVPPPRPHILINEDRMAAIHSLVILGIKQNKNSQDPAKLGTVLAYLNLLVVLRYKWDKFLLQEVADTIQTHFCPSDTNIPEIGFINISNNALIDFLNE
ncbi:Ybp1p Ecym_3074 [Eremothecium cymbalariae DBVPG|uniref:Uncharacterized protein n=1 Tax=Eremothecium cymbalariae (strain CBS 270.75 / DBVPG 7215 / KCTC 17166 / NRRL Y-17582) TaxID=931890 RepID=G8JR17_ERECY|nr:Hypothetical protein Ecym_3074 [Eremothecium cymbalariae DBVPG\